MLTHDACKYTVAGHIVAPHKHHTHTAAIVHSHPTHFLHLEYSDNTIFHATAQSKRLMNSVMTLLVQSVQTRYILLV